MITFMKNINHLLENIKAFNTDGAMFEQDTCCFSLDVLTTFFFFAAHSSASCLFADVIFGGSKILFSW